MREPDTLLTQPQRPRGLNLLRFRPVESLVTARWFPEAFQCLTLAAFVGFAALGWGALAPEGVPAKLYAKSNLVNLVIWGLWWPAMVWMSVLFGRAWCAICPLELVASKSERVGRRLGLRQRPLGRWLRAGWLILLLYGTVQLLVAGVDLHRAPAYTSLFLLGLLALAAAAGLFLKHRAFCRGFCPVGLLLGTYGRGSMLAVRAEHPAPANPEALAAGRALEALARVARSCPSLLNPPKLGSSKDCLICGACVKASSGEDRHRMAILLRPPFARGDARETLAEPGAFLSMEGLSAAGLLLVLAASGVAVRELRLSDPEGAARRVPAILVLALLFACLVLRWGLWR